MLSIIIPTKEEPYINELIAEVHKKVNSEHEIIVVDKSKAAPEIKGGKLILQKSNGLGNAVLEGVREAKGDIILMMDGDGSHDPADINSMIDQTKENDIVIGSKYVPGGVSDDYPSRVFISKMFNVVISGFLGLKIKDIMSGYAMYRRTIFDGLILKPKGYKLLLEIVYKSKKRNKDIRIKEIPVTFYKRKAGESKVGFNVEGFSEVGRIFLLALKLKLGMM